MFLLLLSRGLWVLWKAEIKEHINSSNPNNDPGKEAMESFTKREGNWIQQKKHQDPQLGSMGASPWSLPLVIYSTLYPREWLFFRVSFSC